MKKLDSAAFLYPMPMTIIGAEVRGKPNWLAAAWVARVNYKPAMMGAALGKKHYTNKGIREHREFSVNIPSARQVKEADYVGMVSGKSKDKSGVFEAFAGELKHAPMAKGCPVAMECRVVQVVDLGISEFFIGEVVAAYADEACLTDGKPDVRKIDPFMLTMPDSRYWRVGEFLADAWSVGKPLV